METKILEVRDRHTFISVIAVQMIAIGNPDQAFLLERAGYNALSRDQYEGYPCVLLTRAAGGKSHYDPYDWGDRTFKVSHDYIIRNFDRLKDGDVVDVEYILGETDKPKASERVVKI